VLLCRRHRAVQAVLLWPWGAAADCRSPWVSGRVVAIVLKKPREDAILSPFSWQGGYYFPLEQEGPGKRILERYLRNSSSGVRA